MDETSSKKECRSIHRVDLSLPIVQTDSYEIFYTVPLAQSLRQKPLIETTKKSWNSSARFRSPGRLKHLTGPVYVNMFVDAATESSSTMDDLSSTRMIKNLPTLPKRLKGKLIKDDGDRSRSSSGDRLLYESVGSFDDYNNSNKTRSMNSWQNYHHPQLTSSKMLHARRLGPGKQSLVSSDHLTKYSNTISLENLSQDSLISTNDQLYERIEHLTKSFFPSIQQIRHGQLCPELVSNRLHLHREQKKSFMPILSRTRIVH